MSLLLRFPGPIPEKPISANPGLKFHSVVVFYLPLYLVTIFVTILYLGVTAQQYFVISNCMFLDKKTLIKIKLNPVLNLTIFRETGK